MKKLFITLLAVFVLGCVSRGTNFEMADVRAFQPGQTTYSEAVEKLGKPRATIYNKDGSTTVTWTYANALGGKATRIIFDKDGKMVKTVSIVE